MRGILNSYLAILVVTVAGAIAALLIIHVAYANVFPISGGSAAYYSALE